MTEQPAERLYVEVVSDTTGFARDLRAKIDAEVRDIRARIRAEVDTRGLASEVRAAAEAASQRARVRVQADVDARQVQQAMDAAGRRARPTIPVGADTSAADAAVDDFRRRAERSAPTIRPNVDLTGISQAGRALTALSIAPAIAGGIQMLTSAVVGLSGGLFSMAAAASQAAGALAIIPNLVGVAAQGIGALAIGFSGVGDAVGALAKAEQQQAATVTAGAAATREAAAGRVRAAQQQVAAAEEQVADAQRNAARAAETVRRAQEDLNQSRRDAAERIRDMRMELRHSATDEADAALALRQAREDLQDVEWDPTSTDTERRAAEQAVREARDRLEEVRERRGDLARDVREADREGVEGQDEVRDAHERLTDAMHAQADAQRAVRAAQAGVADAQRGIADAQQGAGAAIGGTTAAMTAQQQAMDNLSPAAQRFARFIYGLKPRWDELRFAVQTALLPPIQRGVTAALPLLDTLQAGLVETARLIGRGAERLGEYAGSRLFRTDVATIMESNNRALASFGRAGFNVLRILQHIGVAVGPLVERFAAWTESLTGGWLASVRTARAGGRLTRFFDKAGDTAALLGDIIGNVARGIFNMGSAAVPAGESLLSTLDDVTERWADWTGSEEGQARLRQFFDMAAPATEALGDLMSSLVDFIIALGEAGGGPLVAMARTLARMLDVLTYILNIPGVGQFIGWFLTLAGVGGAIGMVAGMVLRLAKHLGVLAKIGRAVWTALKVLFVLLRLNPIGIVITAVLALVGWLVHLYRTNEDVRRVIDKAWDVIRDAVVTAWQRWIRPALGALVDFIREDLIPWVVRLWTNTIRPTFGWIGRLIRDVWTNVIRPTFSALATFITRTLPDAFRRGVDAIGRAWDAIKRLAAVPVNFVLNHVYNRGIRAAVNWVADRVGLEWELPPANLIAFGSGGVVPGRPTRRDSRIAAVRPGEGVLVPEATRALGGERGIEWLNRTAERARGGIGDWIGRAAGAISRIGIGLAGGRRTVAAVAWAARAKELLSGAMDEMGSMSGIGWTGAVKGAAGRVAHGAGEWVRDKVAAAARRLAAAVTGVRDMQALRTAADWIRPIMSYVISGGWMSYPGHTGIDLAGPIGTPVYSVGPGVVSSSYDIPGSSPYNNYPYASYGRVVIVNHPGGWQSLYAHLHERAVRTGQQVDTGTPVGIRGTMGNSTGPHLHFEARVNGQPVDPAAFMRGLGVSFDDGGWLLPGAIGANTGRRPEAVLDPEESIAVKALAGLAAAVRRDTTAPAAGAPALVGGNLVVTVGDRRDLGDALDQVDHRLRLLRWGGVHASRSV